MGDIAFLILKYMGRLGSADYSHCPLFVASFSMVSVLSGQLVSKNIKWKIPEVTIHNF